MAARQLGQRADALRLCLCGLGAVVLWLGLASSAQAGNFDVCHVGSAAGQCERPEGLATDTSTGAPSSGHLYVADTGNHRIDVFDKAGAFQFAFGWGVANGASELQKCTSSCQQGLAGSGAGQFSQIEGQALAVDNNPASASFHDLYVFDLGNQRVEKFGPEGNFLLSFGAAGENPCQFSGQKDAIAVGPGGTLYVVNTRFKGPAEFEGVIGEVEKWTSTGVCEAHTEIYDGPTQRFIALAVDGSGNTYVVAIGAGGFRKYDPAGALLEEIDTGITTNALTLDPAGNLWAAQREDKASGANGTYPVITEYSPASKRLRRYGYGETSTGLSGLATDPETGEGAFASESQVRVKFMEAPPAGPIVPPASVEANPVGNVRATINAEVNPEGKATSYHLEYVTQKGFEEQGNSFAGPHTVVLPSAAIPINSGTAEEEERELFSLHHVSASVACPHPASEYPEGKCLEPETAYRFRIVATNADNPTGTGRATGEGTFTTLPLLRLEGTFATEIGTESARLGAEVNPLGIEGTAGFFEVVEDARFDASGFAEAERLPASEELSFGGGEAAVIRSVVLSGLPAGATYHYRFVAKDALAADAVPGSTVIGEAETFTTFALPTHASCPQNEAFRFGAGAALPDCRAYEMVSPLDKEGGNVIALKESFTEVPATLNEASVPAAGEPQRLVYGAYRAFSGAESAPFTSQYLASRGADGWQSTQISPPRGRVGSFAISVDTELKELSPDLCESWWRTSAEPPLSPAAIPGQPNIYRRTEAACGTGAGSFESFTTLPPPHANWNLELQGTSADGRAAVYVLEDSLATPPPAPPSQPGGCSGAPGGGLACIPQLYYQEAGEGTPRFVCVLPSGDSIPSGGCSAGTSASGGEHGQNRRNSVTHALSADGQRVYWTASAQGPGRIYLRLHPGLQQSPSGECEAGVACTLAVSKEAEEAVGSGSTSQFWTAASDGSKAIFATTKVEGSTDISDLYEYDASEKKDHLIAHEFVGLMGASEDATRVYLASREVLAGPNSQGEAPTSGKPNLYLYDSSSPEGERFRFLTSLTAGDLASGFSPVSSQPRFRTSRVTPDGRHAAFMTQATPTDYDNADARSGEADAEVYLFEADANGGEGRLLCASCNPAGARPVGKVLESKLENYPAAASLPIWQSTLYAARPLTETGARLFFNSTDALSPKDSNGVGDVYEWEAPGTGGCQVGEPDYFPRNEGCIDLISSGQSSRESEFVEATPDGHDVFFATLQSLLPQDYGLLDIYDAREGGGLPTPPPPASECEAEACQQPPAAPPFPSPASLGYKGPGNKHGCRKGRVKKKGRCVARHHHKPKHHKKKETQRKRDGK